MAGLGNFMRLLGIGDNRERIVIGLNIGSLTVVGSGLEIRQMHRERLTIIGQIDCLTYGEGGLRGCGG